jgi:iron(III) transport system ATP-binding protein
VSSADPPSPRSQANLRASISVKNLHKRYIRAKGEPVKAIDGISMAIPPGSFVVLLGPSGCGKTSFLRCLAGLETPDDGEIAFGDEIVFSKDRHINRPPEQRRLGMVFQSYAVWPHLNTFDNVAYTLRVRGIKDSQVVRRRVMDTLSMVGIADLAQQHSNEMSGGQQQRVALARAVVAQDGIVLFDEPLSNVDAKLRGQLRQEMLRMQAELGFTAIYVTHDQVEALALASHLAVLSAGRVMQFADPKEVYYRPVDPYVADFVGAVNSFDCTVLRTGEGTTVVGAPFGEIVARESSDEPRDTDSHWVAISRPEQWRLARSVEGTCNSWSGRVESSTFFGSYSEYVVSLDGGVTARVWVTGRGPEFGVGEAVGVCVSPDDIILLP